MPDEPIRVRSKCPVCGGIHEFDVPKAEMDARRGGVPIVDAHQSLSHGRREQLASGVCTGCQHLPEASGHLKLKDT